MNVAIIKLKVSDVQRDEIAEAIDDLSTTERAKIKLLAIRLHSLDMPHGHIAAALNVSDDTVTKYLKTFRKGGVAELIENHQNRPACSVEPFLENITPSLADSPLATAKEAAHRIEEITGVQLSEDPACRIMKRAGMTCRKTASISGRPDPQMQVVFHQEELIPRPRGDPRGDTARFFR